MVPVLPVSLGDSAQRGASYTSVPVRVIFNNEARSISILWENPLWEESLSPLRIVLILTVSASFSPFLPVYSRSCCAHSPPDSPKDVGYSRPESEKCAESQEC